MGNMDQDQAARLVNSLAQQNRWPVIADPRLAFVTPQLKTVFAVWQAQRRGRTMPARSDLTLPDLKTALPNISFLDIVRDGARTRFKVRLAGGALDAFLGKPPTGSFLDEAVPQPFAHKWQTLWQPGIDARLPMRHIARVEFPNRRYYVSETLNAPLATDGETPDIFLTATYFHSRDDIGPRNEIAPQLIQELGDIASLATA
jgi:hypothetical protein